MVDLLDIQTIGIIIAAFSVIIGARAARSMLGFLEFREISLRTRSDNLVWAY
jgi:hypothetical protein